MPYILDDVELVGETDKAQHFREIGLNLREVEKNVNDFWIPRSVIISTEMESIGDEGAITIKTWFAQREDYPDCEEADPDERGCDNF